MNAEHDKEATASVSTPPKPPTRIWATRIISLTFYIAIVAVVFAMALWFEWLSVLQASMINVLLFVGFVLVQRQFEMARELNFLRYEVATLGDYRADMQRQLDDMVHHVRHELATSDEELKLQLANVRSDFSAARPEADDSPMAAAPLDIGTTDVETSPTGMPIASIDPFSEPAPTEPANADSLSTNLSDALNSESLNLHLQPIAEFQSRKPVYFDAFMRLETDRNSFLDQKKFLQLAEQGGLTPTIDKKIVFSSVRMLRKLSTQKKSAGIVCPLSQHTFENQIHFDEITDHLSSNNQFSDSLLIEVRQKDFQLMKPEIRQRLGEISDMGFKLSLANTLDLNFDPLELADLGFHFIKVPASILIHADIDEKTSALNPALLAGVLEEAGMRLVATEVERDSDALALIDINVPLGQGSLFARPRPVKSELLEAEEVSVEPEPHLKTASA